jgi:hypothetical protein
MALTARRAPWLLDCAALLALQIMLQLQVLVKPVSPGAAATLGSLGETESRSASFCRSPGWSTVFKDEFDTLNSSSWTKLDASATPPGAPACDPSYWSRPRSEWNLTLWKDYWKN